MAGTAQEWARGGRHALSFKTRRGMARNGLQYTAFSRSALEESRMRRPAIPIVLLSLLLVLPLSIGAHPSSRRGCPELVEGQAPKSAVPVTAVKQPLVLNSAGAITAAELKDYLSFVASDEMEGRADPSRGLDITAKFIATMLSRARVKPAGDDGTYFQRITLKREKVIADGTQVEVAGAKFSYGKDFLAQGAAGTVTGSMVFAGDGWFFKSKNIDAYREIDPKGKIVIVAASSAGTGLPAGVTYADMAGGKQGEDWIDPATYARQKGAVGLVMLNPLLTQANPDMMERTRKAAEEGRYYVEKLRTSTTLPTIVANYPLAQAIFNAQRETARGILMVSEGAPGVKPFPLSPDRKITLTVKSASETVISQNVVGVVEGSDPTLKNEYVALGAHYDHVGTGRPVNGDAIYNGADDDGSGTVALVTMAEALMKAPRHPKRSVLFVWHMGEEMGLWGSQYFTTFPTVPLDKVVAQLNIDMIGRSRPASDTDPRDKDLSGPNELYVIGSKMMSTELGELSEGVNANYLKLSFSYKYDDPKDPQQFFYRSDHINYARKGVPIIFYFTGVHADYHQPGDEVSKIDFPKYEKIARTIYVTMWEIAESKTRPKVDKPLQGRTN
jgi:hypothetical protein